MVIIVYYSIIRMVVFELWGLKYFEHLLFSTFLKQVKLFYNAEYVIGLHGGGFANTIFCEPNTQVIELKPKNAGDSLEHLAKINNLNYQAISVKAKEIVKSKYISQQGSIEIPLSILKEKILK